MLQQQEVVIDSIDEKLSIVDANNDKSAKIVKAMGSTWGLIKGLFTKAPADAAVSVPAKQVVQP